MQRTGVGTKGNERMWERFFWREKEQESEGATFQFVNNILYPQKCQTEQLMLKENFWNVDLLFFQYLH